MEKWFMLKNRIYNCNRLKCYITTDNASNYNAIVYSINHYNDNIKKIKNKIYILCNTEALSRWKKTRRIIYGNDTKFDVLISYRLLVSKHHFSFPYFMDIDKIINEAKKSIISIDDFMKRKDIVFIYKMPYKNRNRLCDMFNKRITVDKYGEAFKKHLNWPVNTSNDKYLVIRNYKFCLAIENTINQVKWGQMHSDSIDDDYVTEKLWDCMRSGSIPIYFGALNVKNFYPTNTSIINANDFNNYTDLIEFVYSIRSDRKILSKYINWPFKYSKKWYNTMKYYSITPCKLCSYIANYYLVK